MAANEQLSEVILSRIWEDQCFLPDQLHTLTGQPVQVICPGHKNRDTGPDFKQALIRIGATTLIGDVELHLHMSDWYAHGHHRDPHYNQTILHVVFWSPKALLNSEAENILALKANGNHLATVVVQDCLTEPLPVLIARFAQARQETQQKFLTCSAVLQEWSNEMLLSQLDEMGKTWFTERTARFQQWLPSFVPHRSKPEQERLDFQQLLYEAICEGLGYASNKAPFIELARRLPLQQFSTHLPPEYELHPSARLVWIQAMLFGAAGLLPSPHEESTFDAETRDYVTQLYSVWEMLRPCLTVTPLPPEMWCFFRLRPANFPTRRIAALSYLVYDYLMQPPLSHYFELLRFCVEHPNDHARQSRLFEDTLTLHTQGYWQRRYRFGAPAADVSDRFFLGVSRIRDMLISAVFPVLALYARHLKQTEVETQILALYANFPAPEWNRELKTLSARMFNQPAEIPKKLRTASVYQGLLQLSKHYCALLDCSHCPLNRHSPEKTSCQKADSIISGVL